MKRSTRTSIAILFAFAGVSAAAAVNGCTIVNGLVADPPDTGGVVVNEGGGGDAEAGPPGSGCAKPPERPGIPDDGTLEVVAVASKLFLTPPAGALPVGFDLDDSCLLPTAETCKSPSPFDDDKGGLDNRGAQLFALVNDRTDLEKRANDGIVAGKNGFLFKVAKYNGRAADQQVEISILSALGHLDGGDNVKPEFKETEAWTIDEGQFTQLGEPKILFDGWVTGGKVYGIVPSQTSLRLSNTFSVQLAGGIVQLDLDLTGAKPRITKGIVSGRWPATDMIYTVSRQRLSDASTSAICQSNPTLLELARQQICGNVDIMSDRTKDRTGASCDATSMAFSFEAGPAAIGPKMAFTPEDDCPGFDAGGCGK